MMKGLNVILMTCLFWGASFAGAYEDKAQPDIKRHMLIELYKLAGIDQTLASFEKRAYLPAIEQTEGWGKKEHRCILASVHDYLRDPVFADLLAAMPSQLLARNVMFYSTPFGKKVNEKVVHGGGVGELTEAELVQLKQQKDVLVFLQKLQVTANETIRANMKSALKPAILSCTPVPS